MNTHITTLVFHTHKKLSLGLSGQHAVGFVRRYSLLIFMFLFYSLTVQSANKTNPIDGDKTMDAKDQPRQGTNMPGRSIVNGGPIILNLHDDKVAWPGVGNTIALDAGANATVSAPGLPDDNWDGVRLRVRRMGTGILADIFSFNTTGTGITVSGTELQSNNVTIATFSLNAGQLWIYFNQHATKDLVQTVLRAINYRNDTPAGDANIIFSLIVGDVSITVDVSVTSNSFYVTNMQDTKNIDLSDGLSLSEAVVLANLASTTQSPELILTNTITGQLDLIADLEIKKTMLITANEDLTIAGGNIILRNSIFFMFANQANAPVTINGNITGDGSLYKFGDGTLTLSGNNSYIRRTEVYGGTLTINGNNGLAKETDVTVSTGATLELDGSLAIGSLAGEGKVVLSHNALTIGNSTNTSFSGVISGTGSLTKLGAGTLTLSGNNSYTGGTTVFAGTLKVNGSNVLVEVGSLSISTGATFELGGSLTIASLAGAGNVVLSNNPLSIGNSTNTSFSGVISGTGSLRKIGPGTLTLSGNNSYIGGTNVQEGTLKVNGSNGLAKETDVTVSTGALLESNANLIIGSLAGAGKVSLLANELSVGYNNKSTTFAGTFTGIGSLRKVGSGTLVLSGNNTYTGGTVASDGILNLMGTLANSDVTVVTAGTLTGRGTVKSLIVAGTFNPEGLFTIEKNLQLNASSTFTVSLGGIIAGVDFPQVNVGGTVTIQGNLKLTLNHNPSSGIIYSLINQEGTTAISGTFSGLAEGATIQGYNIGTILTASYIGGSGNDFTLTAPLNSAPVITGLSGGRVDFIAGSAYVLIDQAKAAVVTDADSDNFEGGDLRVDYGSQQPIAEDVLAVHHTGTAAGEIGVSGLNITYGGTVIGTRAAESGLGGKPLVISLNANANAANVQQLLHSLIYKNTKTEDPSLMPRGLRIQLNDGDGGTSNPTYLTVMIIKPNRAPMVTLTANNPTYTEGGADVKMFSDAVLSTVEPDQKIKAMTFTISNVVDKNKEDLTLDNAIINMTNNVRGTNPNNGVSYAVSILGTTATVTLTAVNDISAALAVDILNGLGYQNTSSQPTAITRRVTLVSIQDNGGTAHGGVDLTVINVPSDVTVIAINRAPVVKTSTVNTSFIQGDNEAGTPVPIDAGLLVTDADSPTLASAQIAITGNFQVGEDILSFTNDSDMGNILGTYNAATGVMTLTSAGATATVAEWQEALRAIAYSNLALKPTTADRSINFVLNDGTSSSAPVSKTLHVQATNQSPIISGTPATTVLQDIAYSFIPTAVDADDAVLEFSINNMPTWASFNTATGALTGTPSRINVGTTTGIAISVSDGKATATLPPFDLEVLYVNAAPSISGTPLTTFLQDIAYSFLPVAQDADGDALMFSISNMPTWASFNTATGALTGTPSRADVGTTAGIVISVSDGTATTTLPPFNLAVLYVNAAPSISGTPNTFIRRGAAYSFLPTAQDIDGDVLTFSISNMPTWASFNTATGALTGTPSRADVGVTTGIVISVTDGTATNSLPAFDVEVGPAQLITGLELQAADFVYDGQLKSLKIKGTLPAGTSVSYQNNDRTEVGTQLVTATIAGAALYEDLVLTAQLTITPADLAARIRFENADYTYDGSPKALLVQGDVPTEVKVLYKNNSYTDAGSYTATAEVDGGLNYKSLTLQAHLRIAQKQQLIRFAPIAAVAPNAGTISLDLQSNSSLPMQLHSDNMMVAEVLSTGELRIKGLGRAIIRVEQAGDANHSAAAAVTQLLEVRQPEGSKLPVNVHQAVSPNGDGINDFLRIEGIEFYPENKVSIYDANGHLLKEINAYNNFNNYFEGIRRGNQIKDGTYFYVLAIKIDAKWQYEKGFFVIKQ